MKPARIPGGTPAPYGRACVNCAHAKCKCIILPTGSGCERCQRLGKECRPAQTVRRRNQRSSASKFANLEAKVDYVLANYPVLQGSTISDLPPDWDPAGLIQSHSDAADQSTSVIARTATSLSSLSSHDETPYSSRNIPEYHDVLSLLYVPPDMAQKYLDQFRTYHLQYFPFVYIPSAITSDELQAKYPFFWVCIMDVLTTKNPEKGDSFRRINNHIHQRIMVDVAPSMDLLLGIMTFVSWVTYTKRPFLNSYTHILMGVVAELGINQGIARENSIMQDYKAAMGIKQSQPAIRTLEERRAVLGCFLISSSVALSISKIDAMRWTPHMEESLSVLAEAKECQEDEILIALVKIHLVLDRSYFLRRDGEAINSPSFYLNIFKAQLDSVKQEIPPHLQKHRVIRLYMYNADVTINEIALGPSAIPHLPDLQRLDGLYTSLQSTKSWLDIWMEFKPEQYFQLPSTVFFQFIRCIINLYRLTVLEDPAWSQSVVRETANVIEYLDRNIAMLNNCPEYIALEEGKEMNMLEKGLRMFTGLRNTWEPKLMELWGLDMSARENDGSMVVSDNMLPPCMPLTQIEEAWMLEFLGSM